MRSDGKLWRLDLASIDETAIFHPVRIAILTISDTRTSETDTSGDLLSHRIQSAGHVIAARDIVRDDIPRIREKINYWLSSNDVDAIITTGGTGLTGRDITPEAISPLLDKVIDGFSTLFHQVSYRTVGLSTLQSRAMAGLAKNKIIFCLPGSNGAVRDGWDEIIQYQLDSRYRPCNFVELMPRLAEV